MERIVRLLNSRYFWILIAVLVVFAYFFGLSVPFLGPDEPRYAQVAREMFERGDWVTPTLGGHNWFEKPALLYWLEIASFTIFGVSEFAARIGPALFGLGTIASVWLLGSRIDHDKNSEGAKIIGLVAATSLGMIAFAHGASFDITLTFPITAAMVSYFVFDLGDGAPTSNVKGHLPLIAFYTFVGLALLAKGLVGVVFPVGIIVLYHVLSWRPPSTRFLISLLWGGLITAVVAGLWYLPVYQRNGWEFVDEFIIQHHFQRYTSNKYLHPQPFYFFFLILPLMTLPWLPFFLAAIWRSAKDRFAPTSDPTRADAVNNCRRLVTFCAAWLLVPLLFFSFSGSKLPGYIMPSLAPALVITALYINRIVKTSAIRGALVRALGLLTLICVLCVLGFVLPGFADQDSVKGLLAAADARGYGRQPVLTFINVSHNAEFYAAGRLSRDADGKQKRFINVSELISEMERFPEKSALVIVPLEHLRHITESTQVEAELIRDNGENAIVHIKPRR